MSNEPNEDDNKSRESEDPDSELEEAWERSKLGIRANPKRFISFPRGGHLDLDDHGALTAVREFVTHLPTATSQAIEFKGL